MRKWRDMTTEEWLPSRCNVALFRLFALLKVSRCTPTPPTPNLKVKLAFARDQNPVESYTLGFLFSGFVFLYLLDWTMRLWQPHPLAWPLIFLGLLAATAVAIQLMVLAAQPIVALGRAAGIFRGRVFELQVPFQFAWMTFYSLWRVSGNGWAKWLAAIWLALLIINGIAALWLRSARKKVEAIEIRFK